MKPSNGNVRSKVSTGNAVVIGLGKSAIACASYLINEGWNVEMADARSQPSLRANVNSILPGVSIHTPIDSYLFVNADLTVLSCTSTPSNYTVRKQAKEFGSQVVNSLEMFFSRAEKPIISVTGTNGKSSVTTLVRNIIEKNRDEVLLGGCRGYPFMELLNKRQPDAYLLELSAPHLEQVDCDCVVSDVAAILNVSPDHMERYSSVEDYVDSMSKVISDAKVAVINRDDDLTSRISTTGKRITFGMNPPQSEVDYGVVNFSGVNWIVRGKTKLVNLSRCQLNSKHDIMNLLAACAIAEAAGYPVKSARTMVTQFAGLPYRCSTEGEWNGVRWVNDARSTNVGAALAAIESNSRPVVLIAGGLSKGADFSLIPEKVNGRLRGCVFFGRDRRKISKPFNGGISKHHVEDIYDAISVANQLTKEGDCVVFSPGCASNDQFTDFEHRGKTFSQALQMHVL